jgi:hypothetical protein
LKAFREGVDRVERLNFAKYVLLKDTENTYESTNLLSLFCGDYLKDRTNKPSEAHFSAHNQ